MDFTINFSAINLLVVFGATVAANLLGGLWYSPIMFGKAWRKARGVDSLGSEAGGNAGVFVASFVLHLFSASLLAALLGPNAGALEGFQFGALIGLAFVTTAMGVTNLFEHRPPVLIAIHSGYHIASLGLMGFIIGNWG